MRLGSMVNYLFVGAILGVPLKATAQSEVVVPPGVCLAPALTVTKSGNTLTVGYATIPEGPNEVDLTPQETTLASAGQVKVSGHYQNGKLYITLRCVTPRPTGGQAAPVPIEYKVVGGVSVRSAETSDAADKTLIKDLTTAVNDAVTAGRLSDDQIQNAVNRVQARLNSKMQSALVEEVSKRLSTANITNQISALEKEVANLKSEVQRLKDGSKAVASVSTIQSQPEK